MSPFLCIIIVLLCNTLCPFYFCNHLEEEEKAGCFAIIVLRMYCYYKCSVALPHGAVGWGAVCDCNIPDHTHFLSPLFKLCVLWNLMKKISGELFYDTIMIFGILLVVHM